LDVAEDPPGIQNHRADALPLAAGFELWAQRSGLDTESPSRAEEREVVVAQGVAAAPLLAGLL